MPTNWMRFLGGLAATAAVLTAGAAAAQDAQGRTEQSPGGGGNRYIGEEEQERLNLLRAQAQGAVEARDWPQAETLLLRVLELDWDETRSINTRALLAQAYEGQGRHAEAIAAYRTVLERSEETWGGEDGTPRIFERFQLAGALERAGRPREAERVYREGLRLSIEALREYRPGHHSEALDGPHVSTFTLLTSLERVLDGPRGRLEMERLYREVLPLYVRALGEDDAYTKAVRDKLALLALS
jgi:tetratricopeptide (TPR) repeat protein